MARHGALPPNLPPRGLSRVQSAEYLGISPTTFDNLVHKGEIAKPRRIGARVVWDKLKLDAFFDAAPDEERLNPWDAQGPQA